jgi:hypothetical protein
MLWFSRGSSARRLSRCAASDLDGLLYCCAHDGFSSVQISEEVFKVSKLIICSLRGAAEQPWQFELCPTQAWATNLSGCWASCLLPPLCRADQLQSMCRADQLQSNVPAPLPPRRVTLS